MKLTRPILGLVALGLVGFGLYRRTHPPNAVALDSGNGPVIEIHSIAITNNLDLGQFTVDAKSTHDVQITADESQMRNARLLGYFSFTGQDLQVILLDETQYERFHNHSAPTEYLYLSKSAANGTIDVPLAHSGKYYLIFDNSASGSAATVKANLAVRGEMVRVDAPPSEKKK